MKKKSRFHLTQGKNKCCRTPPNKYQKRKSHSIPFGRARARAHFSIAAFARATDFPHFQDKLTNTSRLVHILCIPRTFTLTTFICTQTRKGTHVCSSDTAFPRTGHFNEIENVGIIERLAAQQKNEAGILIDPRLICQRSMGFINTVE